MTDTGQKGMVMMKSFLITIVTFILMIASVTAGIFIVLFIGKIIGEWAMLSILFSFLFLSVWRVIYIGINGETDD